MSSGKISSIRVRLLEADLSHVSSSGGGEDTASLVADSLIPDLKQIQGSIQIVVAIRSHQKYPKEDHKCLIVVARTIVRQQLDTSLHTTAKCFSGVYDISMIPQPTRDKQADITRFSLFV